MTYHPVDEETVDAVSISLHRHHEARRKGSWPNMWAKYADLDENCRNEYRARAGEIIVAVQGAATVAEDSTPVRRTRLRVTDDLGNVLHDETYTGLVNITTETTETTEETK